jgi:DNA-binding MarR family transcriptional regulator
MSAEVMVPKDIEQSALTQVDYEVLAAFRQALRKFQHASDDNVRAAQLTPQQHQALLVLKGGYPGVDEITVTDLADALLVKHHSAVELVARLVKAGLIARRQSGEDRRRVMISITPAGDEILLSLSEANLTVLQSAAPILSDLLRMLKRHGFGTTRAGKEV